jgi:hypothetical protein
MAGSYSTAVVSMGHLALPGRGRPGEGHRLARRAPLPLRVLRRPGPGIHGTTQLTRTPAARSLRKTNMCGHLGRPDRGLPRTSSHFDGTGLPRACRPLTSALPLRVTPADPDGQGPCRQLMSRRSCGRAAWRRGTCPSLPLGLEGGVDACVAAWLARRWRVSR